MSAVSRIVNSVVLVATRAALGQRDERRVQYVLRIGCGSPDILSKAVSSAVKG